MHQTIKAAHEALETGTELLKQAKAATVKASENSMDIVAKVNNEQELLNAIDNGGSGYIVITSDINLTNQVKLKN